MESKATKHTVILASFAILAVLTIVLGLPSIHKDPDTTQSAVSTTGSAVTTIPRGNDTVTGNSRPTATSAETTAPTERRPDADRPASTAAPTRPPTPADPLTQQPATQRADPSTMSGEQLLALLTDAVNKTKSYSGALTVRHVESFDANVTECTGGSLVAQVVNSLVGMVVKPTNETLSFSGGTAVNAEGETVTLLLPQEGNFRLTMSGIDSISAYPDGVNTVVNVTLIPESVGMHDTPTANAAGVGFLDVSSLDLSLIEVTKADIRYTGSTIKAVIAPNGYVTSAEYTIPLHVEGSAQAGPIGGSAVFDGKQTETWDLAF